MERNFDQPRRSSLEEVDARGEKMVEDIFVERRRRRFATEDGTLPTTPEEEEER